MISQIYRAPRIVTEANAIGVKGGFFLDFAAPDADGYIWDLEKAECREER